MMVGDGCMTHGAGFKGLDYFVGNGCCEFGVGHCGWLVRGGRGTIGRYLCMSSTD